MRTRILVSAFLSHGDQMLLLHRGLHKKLAPGMWASVGGHMEPSELNAPLETCYREIMEETGFGRDCITGLKLRYMIVRHVDDELRISLYCFGALKARYDLPVCDEGTLHWVSLDSLDSLPMTFTVTQLFKHWRAHPDTDTVWLGGTNHENTAMTWSAL